jgi:hypothetical protein
MIATIKKLMGPDSSYRKSLGLTATTDSAIVLVSDSTLCARAGQAMDSVSLADDPSQALPPWTHPIYLLKIGPAYGVRSSIDQTGHYNFVFFFDSLWQLLSIGAF